MSCSLLQIFLQELAALGTPLIYECLYMSVVVSLGGQGDSVCGWSAKSWYTRHGRLVPNSNPDSRINGLCIDLE